MNILLITTLYPGYLNQSKIQATHAVHYLAKEWVKYNEVKVIRLWPYYPSIFKFFKKARAVNKYGFSEMFNLDGVDIIRVPILKIPRINYRDKEISKISKNIIKILKTQDSPHLIICDMLNPSIYIGETLAKEYGCKLIASLHNSDISYLSKTQNYNKFRKVDSNINKIVFRSKKVADNFLNLYKGAKDFDEFSTILFGIDKKDIIEKSKLEQKLSDPNKIIMIAASLKKLKNVNVLIEAFAKIKDKDGYKLRIIGNGPERKNLEKTAEDLGCKTDVIFLGEKTREEVLKYMEEADVFAMVSSPETFGLVYVEAMAKGCITIGAKNEGIDGVIKNNDNGYLCEPNNVNALRLLLEGVINLKIEEKRRIISSGINTAIGLNNKNLAIKYLDILKQ